MRKLVQITLLGLLFSFSGWGQNNGRTCSTPIRIDMSDSLVNIESKHVPQTWYTFTTDTLDLNFVITSETGGAYELYLSDTSVCLNGELRKTKAAVSTANVSVESSSAILGLTQEELEGICTCRFCEEGGRKVHVESKKTYLLAVSGDNAGFRLNTKGVKESNVWVQKAWYDLPMTKGRRLVLENILFYGGETTLLPMSQTDLQHLTKILKDNPNMKIEIQGHVNAPGERNTKQNQDLSTGRSEAIYNYLITNGIHAERLTFIGYGNTQMVYPKPVNEWQQKKNRRVEVLIKEI